jgi:ferric-dicitrate binding protein FerR (iron transport regulator)
MSKAMDIPDSVMEDAIGWFDDLRRATLVDNEAFTTWLMRSPTHVEAFLSIAALHGGLAAASASHGAWLESLVAGALISGRRPAAMLIMPAEPGRA